VKSAVNIFDVARYAGVSPATVSRVINNHPNVKEETRRKVQLAIKELKYHPNISAQRLAGGKTRTIAVVIPHYEGLFYSFYAVEILRGVGIVCDALGLDLLLYVATRERPDLPVAAGGVIFADTLTQYECIKNTVERGIPTVVINNVVDEIPVDCFAIDNRGGAREAVEYLISLGHTRIAHITGDLRTQSANDRLIGYKEALLKAGVEIYPEYIQEGDFSRLSARIATEKLIKLKERPTAIFVASDEMALEVLSTLREHGINVPRDISIVGFDDSPAAIQAPVPLTTVKQPLLEMAREAVEELHRIIENRKGRHLYMSHVAPHKIYLHTELVIRSSCQPPAF